MNLVSIKKQFESKRFRKVMCALGIALVALLIFQAGIFVGYHKARFAYRWGDGYSRTFGEPRHMIGNRFGETTFFDAHGAAGKVIDIALPTITVEGPDNVEKVILVKNDTVVRRLRDTLRAEDLKAGDALVIFGSPNDKGQIEARLIRIMPPQLAQTERKN